jgi:hypothetical protein
VGDQKNLKKFWPVLIVLGITLGFVILRLSNLDWDPVALAEIGTRYQSGDPAGTEGYDGQFAYYIATNPSPSEVAGQLDVPAYRYQRILLPLAARILAFGQRPLIPWALLLINIIAHIMGTWIITDYLIKKEIPPRYALIHGLWVGLIIGVGADLFEPLAFLFVVAGYYGRLVKKWRLSYLFLLLAILAKEITITFWAAALIADFLQKPRRSDWAIALIPGVIFAVWQLWLWVTFGSPGIGSGGAMATAFEWIPYAGFLRIGTASLEVLILFLIVFGPTIVIPSIFGLLFSAKNIFNRLRNSSDWALLLNSILIAFLPFSTFREPLGLLRVATGMVTSLIFFSTKYRLRRPLNYAMFWIGFLVILLA